MNRTTLFERNDSLETMLNLQKELVDSKLFKLPTKRALTAKTDITKEDVMIATSNVDDFITVWARHERKGKKRNESASYGVRVKTSLADIPSMKVLLDNMNTSFNDESEYRITCYSANDVKFFVTTILKYIQTHSINRQSKEVATTKATVA